jgi:hypothetical protein
MVKVHTTQNKENIKKSNIVVPEKAVDEHIECNIRKSSRNIKREQDTWFEQSNKCTHRK